MVQYGIEMVREAADNVYRHAIRTPVLRDIHLSKKLGADVYLKMELYQPTHSFKVRGASNKLSRTDAVDIVTASSGNHGLAIAYVSSEMGKRAHIVLPENVNKSKLRMIEELGAHVLFCGTESDERIAFAKKYAEQNGMPLIPSFDDADIIAGQGTAGLEIMEMNFDSVICPVGGGGLIAGISLCLDPKRTGLYGVQPEGANAMKLSLSTGRPVTVKTNTLADGISVSTPGALNVRILSGRVRDILLVPDEKIVEAMREMWEWSHVLMEPASASSVAALTLNSELFRERKVCLIITGGNVSDEMLARLASHRL